MFASSNNNVKNKLGKESKSNHLNGSHIWMAKANYEWLKQEPKQEPKLSPRI